MNFFNEKATSLPKIRTKKICFFLIKEVLKLMWDKNIEIGVKSVKIYVKFLDFVILL